MCIRDRTCTDSRETSTGISGMLQNWFEKPQIVFNFYSFFHNFWICSTIKLVPMKLHLNSAKTIRFLRKANERTRQNMMKNKLLIRKELQNVSP